MKKRRISCLIVLIMLLGIILSGCSVKYVKVDFKVQEQVVLEKNCIALFEMVEIPFPNVTLTDGYIVAGWTLDKEYGDYENVCEIGENSVTINLKEADSDKFVFNAIIQEVASPDDNGTIEDKDDMDYTPSQNVSEKDIIPVNEGLQIQDQTIKKYIVGNCDTAYKAIALDEITSLARAKELQEVYREILKQAIVFAENKTNAPVKDVNMGTSWGRPIIEKYGYFTELNVEKYNLNINEACLVFGAFRKDNPYFYWLSRTFTYSTQLTKISRIELYCDLEYKDASTRQQIQKLLEKEIASYDEALKNVESKQLKAKVFHDTIIKEIDYRYDYVNGKKQASMANGAHNIVGVLDRTGVVCEGYARMFQYLCNYYHIPNRYVIGYAGEAHAWNLFMADDEKYYWIDITWDDKANSGVSNKYFGMANDLFLKEHKPFGYAGYTQYGSSSISKNWQTKNYNSYYIDWQYRLPSNISKTSLAMK